MTVAQPELRWHAIGRRKTSVARVYLTPGSGKWDVNGRTLGDYFPRRSLVQHIQQRSNNLLQVEEGSLYPALQRLLKAKLVKAEWELSSTNRRVRTYQITAAGLRHLEQQISSFERMFEGISLVLNPG